MKIFIFLNSLEIIISNRMVLLHIFRYDYKQVLIFITNSIII